MMSLSREGHISESGLLNTFASNGYIFWSKAKCPASDNTQHTPNDNQHVHICILGGFENVVFQHGKNQKDNLMVEENITKTDCQIYCLCQFAIYQPTTYRIRRVQINKTNGNLSKNDFTIDECMGWMEWTSVPMPPFSKNSSHWRFILATLMLVQLLQNMVTHHLFVIQFVETYLKWLKILVI